MSRCHSGIRTSRATAEQRKYKGNIVRSSWFLLARHADSTELVTAHSTQYRARTPTIKSAYADSSALANSITEGSVLLGTDYTELVFERRVQHARLRPRLAARKTYWTSLRTAALAARFSIRSIYTPSVRTKLQTNCTCWSAACYSSTQFHQQTYVIQTIRRDSRRMILQLFQSHLEQHFEFSSSISNCLFLMTAVKLL